LKKVCGGGVIQTQVMATDGQLLLPSTKEIFSRFGTSLFGSGPFFCCFVFTGTIPIWWEVSGGFILRSNHHHGTRLDGPRHLSLRLFFYFWP
jgi:hypothetical protein